MIALCTLLFACKKESDNRMHYYEIGLQNGGGDWRDSSFIVATSDPQLINAVNVELSRFSSEKKHIIGTLVRGNGGYNKNGTHEFNWRLKEDDWTLTDASVEIYDGRPYSDVHLNPGYWMDTMKRFGPWSSYIKREVFR